MFHLFLTFKKWTALYLLCLILLFIGFAAILWQGSAIQASKNEKLRQGPVLIIDPGHGGEDGGALAGDGTKEADVNLAVALRLEELARFLGAETVMTRREDVSIHDAGAATVRARKVSDLQNRAKLCGEVPNGVLISIHQNSLPGVPSVHGAQVFYGGGAGSEELALSIQEVLNAAINRSRPKEVKPGGSGVYLLKEAACPAVLVECGFLSNDRETAMLRTQDYQTRLAVTILAGLRSHLTR